MLKKFLLTSIISFFIAESFAQRNAPLFTELPATRTHIDFKNTLTETVDLNAITYEYFYNGGGVAVGDINNDGLPDIFFTGNMVENKLYLNKGNMKFEDITKKAGVAGHTGWKTGVTMVDINGDGLLDIYVCYSGNGDSSSRRHQLFINQGNLTFKDEATHYGVDVTDNSTQAVFFDYDRDGDLDLFLLNHNPPAMHTFDAASSKNSHDSQHGDKLLRNDNGHFVDVTVQAGIKNNPIQFGLGVTVADFNRDGWPDLYVSNDYLEQDYLYINNGDGTFTDHMEDMMGHVSYFSMGSDAADYNNDGWPDVVSLDMLPPGNYRQKLLFAPENYEFYENMINKHFYYQQMRNMLQLNNGNGTFSEIGQIAGMSNTDWSWSPLFADFNNDGNKDLLITSGYPRDLISMDFQKFYADERMKANKGERNQKILEMLKQVPSVPVQSFIFKNNGDLTFTDESSAWGFGEKTFSNGAAYADLDNDGDLDIVINRLNNTSVIYQNNLQQSHYVDVSFMNKGSKNYFGIGASVTLYSDGMKQFQEFYPSRGFQSAMHVPLHFGVKSTTIDSMIITWPDEKVQRMVHINADQKITANYQDARSIATSMKQEKEPEIFSAVPSMIPFRSEEDEYIDFKIQPAMPNMISFCAPRCAKGDVNGDGLDDLYFCGTKDYAGKLFIQTAVGNFVQSNQPELSDDSIYYDTDALFFDADGDGDKDLYIVSGGYETGAEDSSLQDRIYFNENGIFKRRVNALPKEFSSGSCVSAADIDGDGDLDLFVGGRVIPGQYPEAPESFILLNDGKGNFRDATNEVAPALKHIGLVTDAIWMDVNKDHRPDLIIVGEWMGVKFFINHNGHLIDESEKYLPEKSTGWWNRIYADDFDGDGDTDLVIGNAGLNFQMKVSEEKPAEMYYADFDNNGYVDPFIFYYIGDSLWPLASRDEALDQMISLRKKFTNYAEYARASVGDVLTPDQLKEAKKLDAVRFETSYLENEGDHFEFKSLPIQAQYSPVFAITSLDYDGDGNKDLLLAGNSSHVRIRFGKMDANYGVLLKGDGKGNFAYVPQTQSGLNVRGDVRDVIQIKNSTGNYLVFGINQQEAQVYKLNEK